MDEVFDYAFIARSITKIHAEKNKTGGKIIIHEFIHGGQYPLELFEAAVN